MLPAVADPVAGASLYNPHNRQPSTLLLFLVNVIVPDSGSTTTTETPATAVLLLLQQCGVMLFLSFLVIPPFDFRSLLLLHPV